jgi:hypothetical protein
MSIERLIQDHIDKFGVAPVITGVNFSEPEKIWEGIEQAIEDGIPYEEEAPSADEVY